MVPMWDLCRFPCATGVALALLLSFIAASPCRAQTPDDTREASRYQFIPYPNDWKAALERLRQFESPREDIPLPEPTGKGKDNTSKKPSALLKKFDIAEFLRRSKERQQDA